MKLYYWIFVFFLISQIRFAACQYEEIELDEKNNIVIRGRIDEQLADEFIYNLIKNNPKYVYINSPGGSILAGNRIVSQLIQRNVTCIAERAYSMGFVILQACNKRYITPMSTVMQHQASLGIRGELYQITNYLNMVHAIENKLNKMQAERIGLKEDEFRKKITTEWWLFAENIIQEKVADKVVNLVCSKELLHSKVKSIKHGFFEDRIEIYSGCPLIQSPLEVENKDSLNFKMREIKRETVPSC